MIKKTGGIVADCKVAKLVRLCERDPVTAAVLCPVTCGMGCAADTTLAATLLHTFGGICLAIPQAVLLQRLDTLVQQKCGVNVSCAPPPAPPP